MTFQEGDWVRVTVSGKPSEPLCAVAGTVHKVTGVNTHDRGLYLFDQPDGRSRYVYPQNVEPWVPRPGERVRVRGLYEATVVSHGESYAGGPLVWIDRTHTETEGGPWNTTLDRVSPILNAEGFPLGALPKTAEAAPAAPPPPLPSLACACGASLVESFFSRACERGHVGVDTYRRVESAPTLRFHHRYLEADRERPSSWIVNANGNAELRPAVFENVHVVTGNGREAIGNTAEQAMAAWKAAR